MPNRGYDDELALWAENQARALRHAGEINTNLSIDWENVTEEIEALGKSQGRELASRKRSPSSAAISSVCWRILPASGRQFPA